MCVSDKASFLPFDLPQGATCHYVRDGVEYSTPVVSYEERNGGSKLVLFDRNDEAFTSFERDEKGNLYSLSSPVIIIGPDSTTVIQRRPTTSP